jgi:hypothetical protein
MGWSTETYSVTYSLYRQDFDRLMKDHVDAILELGSCLAE